MFAMMLVMDAVVALAPVFFALAVGYAAGRFRIIDNIHVDGLNTLVMKIALPLVLFTILAGAHRADVIDHGGLALAVLFVMGVTYLVVFVLQKTAHRRDTAVASVQALTVAFPNTGALALPIAESLLGPTGELAVAVSLAVGALTLSPLTITLLELRNAGTGSAARRAVRAFGKALATPVVVAPAVGLAWSLAGIPLPALLSTTLDEIGGLTAGLALFVTGLVLSSQRLTVTGEVAWSVLVADIARPLLAIGVVAAVGMTGMMAAEVVLLMAVPSGFFGVLMALARRVPAGAAGPTLFYSTVLSAATLPAVILLLPILYPGS